MPKPLERRRKPRRKAIHVTGPTWVLLENVPGARADVRAKVVDFNEAGIRIHVSLLLQANHMVVVKGQASGVIPDGRAHARVVDCRALTGSGYTVGLTFERDGSQDRHQEAPEMDGCEIFKLNPNRKVRGQILEPNDPAIAGGSERAMRREILELLYTARRSQPGRPSASLHELEELLGCPRERLDFSLWYLTESALIISENGDYSITVKGVDHVESEEAVQRRVIKHQGRDSLRPESQHRCPGAACGPGLMDSSGCK